MLWWRRTENRCVNCGITSEQAFGSGFGLVAFLIQAFSEGPGCSMDHFGRNLVLWRIDFARLSCGPTIYLVSGAWIRCKALTNHWVSEALAKRQSPPIKEPGSGQVRGTWVDSHGKAHTRIVRLCLIVQASSLQLSKIVALSQTSYSREE